MSVPMIVTKFETINEKEKVSVAITGNICRAVKTSKQKQACCKAMRFAEDLQVKVHSATSKQKCNFRIQEHDEDKEKQSALRRDQIYCCEKLDKKYKTCLLTTG